VEARRRAELSRHFTIFGPTIRSGLDIKLDHGVDNMAMAISLVASTRGLAIMPAYAKNLLPWSVVNRPLEGEAPTIDLAVGYSKANTSPIPKLFLSRIDDLTRLAE
jgi:LysR family transcriptional regulator, hca operon transcriptional activator